MATKKRQAAAVVHGRHYLRGTDIEVTPVRVITAGKGRILWRKKDRVDQAEGGAYYAHTEVEIR